MTDDQLAMINDQLAMMKEKWTKGEDRVPMFAVKQN
jgi:hypothetical protein